MFESLFWAGMNVNNLLISMAISLVCGIVVSASYLFKNERYSRNLSISLVIFPIITQAVIMMVGNNAMIGVGVAIAGAFSLVRFRSITGNSRDISCIFLAMAIGVATGLGYIYVAMLFTTVVCVLLVALKFIPFDMLDNGKSKHERELKITCPEDVDYETELMPIVEKHSTKVNVVMVKTSQMGSLFEIVYRIRLNTDAKEKQLLDDLRVKNGNLPIIIRQIIDESREL